MTKLGRLAACAAVALTAGACHSGGTYFQNPEPMPYGPGVVDCSWYQRTENAYVRERCMTPGPVAIATIGHTVQPRAARGDQHLGCPGEYVPEFQPMPEARRAAPEVQVTVREAPRAAPVPTTTTYRRGYESGTVTVQPGISFQGSEGWDDPVPPPRPGAPLPRPTGGRGGAMGR